MAALGWKEAAEGIKNIAPNIGALFGTILNYRTDRKNRESQEAQNAMDRRWQEDMYRQQRNDSLADWNMQNAYNSPEEQMNRLRQAGINPNWYFGKGAESTAQSIRASTAPTGNQTAPRNEPGIISSGIEQYYRLNNIQANTDNLAQNVALSKEEALVKQATVAKMGIETARNKFDLDQAAELKDMVIRQAKLNNAKTEVDIEQGQQNVHKTGTEILALMQQIEQNFQMNPKQLELIQAQIQNAQLDGRLKAAEEQLKAKGVNSNDPAYIRMLMQMIMDPEYFKDLTRRLK